MVKKKPNKFKTDFHETQNPKSIKKNPVFFLDRKLNKNVKNEKPNFEIIMYYADYT